MGDIQNKQKVFSLRKATPEDLEFLFRVSTLAMKPVVEVLNPDKEYNEREEFLKYKAKFKPEEIDVIQYRSQDVGRLRVVRDSSQIYIGGIQILPEFQGRRIGTELFKELIQESTQLQIPIVLEVHIVNENAKTFYQKLGFKIGEQVKDKIVMRYIPK